MALEREVVSDGTGGRYHGPVRLRPRHCEGILTGRHQDESMEVHGVLM